MKKATSSPDNSRDSKPGRGRPKSAISKSSPLKRPGCNVCSSCGKGYSGFEYLKALKAHDKCCRHHQRNSVEDEFEVEYTEYWLDGGIGELDADFNSEVAMDYLNDEVEGGKKYDFVENGPSHAKFISRGLIVHFNFKAKERDCPSAQVETFFAQGRQDGTFLIDCCVSLGPSHELPRYDKADVDGCRYCRDYVHHPVKRCAKLIRGVSADEASWLYGDK